MSKRFINDIDDGKLIDTKGELSTIYYSDSVDFYELCEFLNKLNDEKEEFKQGVLNRIDTYIWQWEDEASHVAEEMESLKDDIERGYFE